MWSYVLKKSRASARPALLQNILYLILLLLIDLQCFIDKLATSLIKGHRIGTLLLRHPGDVVVHISQTFFDAFIAVSKALDEIMPFSGQSLCRRAGGIFACGNQTTEFSYCDIPALSGHFLIL